MPALEDKVSLITGAGSGIGQATAVRFGAEGAIVVCLDHVCDDGLDVLEELLAELPGGRGVRSLQHEPGAAVGVLQAEEVVPIVGRQAPEFVLVFAAEQPGPLEVDSPEVDVLRAVDVVVPREGVSVAVGASILELVRPAPVLSAVDVQ